MALKAPKKKKKKRAKKKQARKNPIQRIGVMNFILIIVGVSLLAFTLEMIHLFEVYGYIPDTLCSCVFVALGGECGIMGWIRTSKEKNRDREWEEADRKLEREESLSSKPEPAPTHDDEPVVVADSPVRFEDASEV